MNPSRPGPSTGAFAPTDGTERLVVLDALRGFALLGILLMNVEFFARPLQGILLGFDTSLGGADRDVAWWTAALVQGKFWTLFSLLFGMGFALMMDRAAAAGAAFVGVQVRRLAALLLIGLLHAVLIWAGDILVTYALGGFVLLLLFRSVPVEQLWRVGLLLYVAPLVLMWMGTLGVLTAQLDPEAGAEMMRQISAESDALRRGYATAAEVYRNGSWIAVLQQRIDDSLMLYGWLPFMLPSILGIFMIGTWLLRSGIMHDAARRTRVFSRFVLLGGPIGLACALGAMPHIVGADLAVPTPAVAWGTTLMTVANLLLCLAYAGVVVLVAQRVPAVAVALAPVGRMALSNYLAQSVVFSTLFYGYGVGLWGEVSRAQMAGMAVAFFLLQVLASHLWLARFRFGPAEWLWRGATYGRVPPLRRG